MNNKKRSLVEYLEPVPDLISFYKKVVLPPNYWTRYYPEHDIQIWKVARNEFLVVDVNTNRGAMICDYPTAQNVKFRIEQEKGILSDWVRGVNLPL